MPGNRITQVTWAGLVDVPPQSFRCGYCGDQVGGRLGYQSNVHSGDHVTQLRLYICTTCNQPTYFDPNGYQTPGVSVGSETLTVPDTQVLALYNEARRCVSVNAYTAAVMVCRKLLVNTAHAASGKKFKTFEQAIDWLVDSEYVPGRSRAAFDQIRKVGNEANHEVPLMQRDDAESMIRLSEELLRLVFEFPNIPVPPSAKAEDDESEE